MKNSTLNAQNRNANVGVSPLNQHHMEDGMDKNHFADLLDARDGVHPERGNWNPEPSTDAPDQEYLDTMNEDVFGILIGEGHGVRVHKTDRPWMGKLDLDPENCKHRMVSTDDIFGDFWEPALERPQEDLTPLEAGPWEDEAMDEFGDWNVVEYLIATHEDEYCDETVVVLKDAHIEEQRSLQGLDSAFDNAIRVSELSAAKEQRNDRFVKVLTWMSTCDFKEMQKHKGRLWNKVNTSRKQAGKYNRWGWVYLTKQQMNAVNEVINFRVGEYNDSFKKR